MSHSCGYRRPIRYDDRNAVAGSLPAQYSVNEFIASSTPFFTPSSNSKSPTTSFAAKGLNSSSPPVFSLTVAHQFLKVASPTPAGHDVWTFHVVVSAACASRTKGADSAAPATATPPVLSSVRRVGAACPACAGLTERSLAISSPFVEPQEPRILFDEHAQPAHIAPVACGGNLGETIKKKNPAGQSSPRSQLSALAPARARTRSSSL